MVMIIDINVNAVMYVHTIWYLNTALYCYHLYVLSNCNHNVPCVASPI